MTFVNGYDFHQRARFRKLVLPLSSAPGTPATDVLAAGDIGQAGLAARINTSGKVLWARTYSREDAALSFFAGAATAGDGFLLLAGSGEEGPRSQDDTLVRLDGAGAVVWSRRIPTEGYGALRLVRSLEAPEEFLLVGWLARNTARHGRSMARLLSLKANGSVVRAVELAGNVGGRLLDVVAVPKGYVLVGDAGDPRSLADWITMDRESDVVGAAGLVVDVGLDLAPRGAWRLQAGKETEGWSARVVLAPSSDVLIVLGCRRAVDRSQSIFAARFARNGATLMALKAVAFDARPGPERPVAAAILDGHLAILVHPDASGLNATVLRLDGSLAPSGHDRVTLSEDTVLTDLRVLGPGVADMTAVSEKGGPNPPILISVGARFECCKTMGLDPRATTPLDISVDPIRIGAEPLDVAAPDVKVAGVPVDFSVKSLCGVRLDWGGERMVQSRHLDLQAAGSDGTHASRGILLRWFLTGALDGHLPKGDRAGSNLGFNKPDDYVTLYRAEWPATPIVRRLVLASDLPLHVDDPKRAMFFVPRSSSLRDLFAVRFMDPAGYAAAKQVADPRRDPMGFIAAYGAHPIEVELRDRLAVACDLSFQADPGGTLQVETRSAAENLLLAPMHVTSRQVLGPGDGPVKRLVAENLRSVRVRCAAARIEALEFICYEDLLAAVNESEAWTELGRFALTDDDATAFRRLEDPARFQVDNHWRKYNDNARVNVDNYRRRWSAPAGGLAEGVRAYIQLSDNDPSASARIHGAGLGDGAIQVSYRDLLQVAAIDYHVARMLGLGRVDDEVAASTRYIHLAVYVSLGNLQDGRGERPVQHLYMSLPTTLADVRPPLVPDLDGVDYGLSVPTGTGPPHQLTDAQGYTPEGDARYIRLYPGCRPLYASSQDFWTPPDLFDLSRSSLPTLYGVEYRKGGELGWRKPEIAHDPAYPDTGSPPTPEVLSTPFPVDQYERAFIHKETELGVHEYAVYAVNLFSLPSPVGPPRATDATVFRRRNVLQPPSDLHAQFIEPESPLVLTTAAEQAVLTGFGPVDDRTLVRLCCNYGFAQDLAYPFADRIEILHRRELPRLVKGAIRAMGPTSDPALWRIETKPYTYPATKETVAPVVAQALKPNFIGGVLVAGSYRLLIEDIQWPPGQHPVFVVRTPKSTGAVVSDLGATTLVAQDAVLDLHAGDLIMAIENMAAGGNWGAGNPLPTTIAIGDSSWQRRIEAFTRPDGTPVSRSLRGVWESADVKEIPASSKRYEISFDTYSLAPHPQAAAADPVSWWKGTVRVSVDPINGRHLEDRRALAVLQAAHQGGRLVLVAADDSGEPDSVLTGSALLVNYYPGYKIYLHADAANGFDWPALAPAAGEGSRTTLVGLRSRDSGTLDTSNQPYRSAVGAPQLLATREIVEPERPEEPLGLAYATPPDVYGKSSYTLTVGFNHRPFSAVFYRADAFSLLEAIYDPTTIHGIRAAIFPPDQYFASRFADLFAFMENTRTTMSVIPTDAGGSYVLPVPDRPELGLSGALDADDKARIQGALFSAFVPLTEKPLIYDAIRTDPDYVPTNRPQSFRDANGDLLPANQMDLAPMAKRPATGNSVQFTDFTLDGSMNPDTLYFYCAREISREMQIGDASPVSKPVKLINLTAPAAPQLRRMIVAPYDAAASTNPQVRFELIEPLPIDPIARVRLFRTSDAAEALSVRTMEMVKDFDLAALPRTSDGAVIVADDFAESALVPYGDPLFYKAAWVREVRYQDAALVQHTAQVLSEPTRTFLANVIDVVNPPPPAPAVTVTPAASSGERLVHISWPTTVHNGTYYVSQLDSLGNWTRIGLVKTNAPTATLDLPGPFPIEDDQGRPIYYRFKVDVQGASGLLNTSEAPVTVRLL